MNKAHIHPLDLAKIVANLRDHGKRSVFTNGVFDILHVGHARYLNEARALGDILIVAVNSDSSVRRLKGSSRPIVAEDERMELLGYLRCVDYVVRFEEDTPVSLIELVRPDIYVKGGDYSIAMLPEAKVVASYGGETRVLQLVEGRSSTNLVNAIMERYGKQD